MQIAVVPMDCSKTTRKLKAVTRLTQAVVRGSKLSEQVRRPSYAAKTQRLDCAGSITTSRSPASTRRTGRTEHMFHIRDPEPRPFKILLAVETVIVLVVLLAYIKRRIRKRQTYTTIRNLLQYFHTIPPDESCRANDRGFPPSVLQAELCFFRFGHLKKLRYLRNFAVQWRAILNVVSSV